MSDNQPKKSFVGKIVKTAIFMVLAAAAVAGNFWWEQMALSKAEVPVFEAKFHDFVYERENFLPERGVIRFDQEFEGEADFDVIDSSGREHVFQINNGRMWGNLAVSNAKVNILLEGVVLVPNQAQFDLSFDGKRLELAVYEGDVYMGFLAEGEEVSNYQEVYSEQFENGFVVARGREISLNITKVNKKLRSLLTSKLEKELKYRKADAQDPWVIDNLSQDGAFREGFQREISSEIIRSGERIEDGSFGQFVDLVEGSLTFVPEKREEDAIERIFKVLSDVVFFSVRGDEAAAEERMVEFQALRANLPEEFVDGEKFIGAYDQYLMDLGTFDSDDDEYRAYLRLLERKFADGRDQEEVLNELWLGVYDGIAVSQVKAEENLNRFYQKFDSMLGGFDDAARYKSFISFYNQLFDNLFITYEEFFRDGYFAMKNSIEQQMLGLYGTGQLKDEIRQAIVSKKIDFLKRLRQIFFASENFDVDEAREILSRLVEEIDDLMAEDSSELAVVELFEAQLKDIGDFWGYLNSPEYNNSKIYGFTHQERYESFLEEQQKIWSFVDVQTDVLGEETVVEVEEVDVEAEVLEAFEGFEDYSGIEVGEIEEVNQRYVQVSGSVGGYPFDAEFDRFYGLLTNLYAHDELISDRSVKMTSALPLIQDYFLEIEEDLPDEEEPLEELTEETNAERIARIFIATRVAEQDFVVTIENIEVLDDLNTIYRVNAVALDDYPDILLTFDYNATQEKAINVFLVSESAPTVLDGEFTLEDLPALVLAEHERLTAPPRVRR